MATPAEGEYPWGKDKPAVDKANFGWTVGRRLLRLLGHEPFRHVEEPMRQLHALETPVGPPNPGQTPLVRKLQKLAEVPLGLLALLRVIRGMPFDHQKEQAEFPERPGRDWRAPGHGTCCRRGGRLPDGGRGAPDRGGAAPTVAGLVPAASGIIPAASGVTHAGSRATAQAFDLRSQASVLCLGGSPSLGFASCLLLGGLPDLGLASCLLLGGLPGLGFALRLFLVLG